MPCPVNINDLLDRHVVLDLTCIDRIYLNGTCSKLQVGGQVVTYLTEHLGNPIPSPALFQKKGDRFRKAVRAFADSLGIPILKLKKPDRSRWDDRKLDHVRPYLDKAREPGVVAIVSTQEIQRVFVGYARGKDEHGKAVNFGFDTADRRVSVYYFYILDARFGAGFIKIATYFPYPLKVWANGHEWAKRRAGDEGLVFTELKNGFATCEDPEALQAICDGLSPGEVQSFFDRWIGVIPTPFDVEDRLAGYWWDLYVRQVEISRTVVFDAPRRARGFFESLVADNIGIGRPEAVSVVFDRRVQKNTPGIFRTRVFTQGTEVKLDFTYKKERVKEYLKEGIALRIETVINNPWDLGILKGLAHLPEMCAAARRVNARLLTIQRAGQGCAIETALLERISQPYVREGQRTGALRFGDVRVMALAGALCMVVNALGGFTNRSLRAHVAELLGTTYTASQMSYDLRRLRLHGLIERLPRSNVYAPTPDGIRVALFYTKVHDRLLRPLLAADHPPAPLELRRALRTIDAAVESYVTNAQMKVAA
jgi:hypothetical protein